MAGECDLETLLATMAPVLDPAVYHFLSVDEDAPPPLHFVATDRGSASDIDSGDRGGGAGPLMVFREAEGTTLIIDRDQLAPGDPALATPPWRRITLSVHSDLEAVGFLAAVTARLAAEGISTNAVSAFYHDHLFVPASQADRAMALLTRP